MSQQANAATLTLSPQLDISGAENLLADVKKIFDESSNILVDASAVERITTPSIQILLSLFTSCEKTDKSCHVHAPSDSVRNAFADLGLTNELEKRVA